MDLRHLEDNQLLVDTDIAIRNERKSTIVVLHHLREVERRKLFPEGCGSLYDYLVKKHGYSENEAVSRISAMRLLKELPEIESAISSGKLGLTNLASARSFFMAEEKVGKVSREEKLDTLRSIVGKTTREVKRALIEKSSHPIALQSESVKPVSQELNEIKTYIDDETLQLFSRIKGLLVHKHGHLSNSELLKIMAQMTFDQLDPGREPKRKSKVNRPWALKVESQTESRREPKRTPSAPMSRELFRRSGGKCAKCGSHYAPQRDHKIEFALGGKTTLENMQILCFNCNQRKRIERFGYRAHEKQ